jgi:DNA-binding transcriptional LysR family regulator
MDTRELLKVDLNLLISLDVLLEERNVSRAAERLYITQPAMSKTLARLRKVFDDPLFTRTSHGMLPTPRAQELKASLGHILADIGELVSGPGFDPYAYTGEITLALSEYIGVALLPPLIHKLHRLAPRLSIRTITRVENQLEQLTLGNLDFAIQIEQARYPDDFLVEAVDESPPAILVRQDHPLTRGRITWDRLSNYPFIRLYIPDMDQVEVLRSSPAFNRVRNPQQGSLETSHLLTALEVLRNTEYFMPGPAYILQNPRVTEGITALPNPDGEAYRMKYMLVAHKRTTNSPVHQWFREQMLDTIRRLQVADPAVTAFGAR